MKTRVLPLAVLATLLVVGLSFAADIRFDTDINFLTNPPTPGKKLTQGESIDPSHFVSESLTITDDLAAGATIWIPVSSANKNFVASEVVITHEGGSGSTDPVTIRLFTHTGRGIVDSTKVLTIYGDAGRVNGWKIPTEVDSLRFFKTTTVATTTVHVQVNK